MRDARWRRRFLRGGRIAVHELIFGCTRRRCRFVLLSRWHHYRRVTAKQCRNAKPRHLSETAWVKDDS